MLFKQSFLFLAVLLFTNSSCSKQDKETTVDNINLQCTISVFAGSETERNNVDHNDPLKARFDHPTGLALDGSTLWVADGYNESALRKIDLSTGKVSTAIRWNNFDGLAGWRRTINDLEVNPVTHKILMVTKEGELWQYDPVTEERTILINSTDPYGSPKDEYQGVQVGSLANASLAEAYGLAISHDGKYIYLSDNVRGVIKMVNLASAGNEVTVFAGKPYAAAHDVSEYPFLDGPHESATFSSVQDLAVNKNNQLIVVDNGWSCIRMINGDQVSSLTNHNPGVASTGLNKDGSISNAILNRPNHVAIADNGIYFNDYTGVRLLIPGKQIITLHPDFSRVHMSGAISASIAATPDGKTVYEAQGNVIYKYEVQQ